MQVHVRTDRNIEGHEALAAQVRGEVKGALNRVSDRITRVDVHLSDENSHKRGDNDQRCMLEARLEGRQPVAVTHQAASLFKMRSFRCVPLVRGNVPIGTFSPHEVLHRMT